MTRYCQFNRAKYRFKVNLINASRCCWSQEKNRSALWEVKKPESGSLTLKPDRRLNNFELSNGSILNAAKEKKKLHKKWCAGLENLQMKFQEIEATRCFVERKLKKFEEFNPFVMKTESNFKELQTLKLKKIVQE